MSSFAGYCPWCNKPAMHKTLFGTLHICLTDEEKQAVLYAKRQQSQQVTGQRANGLINALNLLKNAQDNQSVRETKEYDR